jgi:hypothetical protein
MPSEYGATLRESSRSKRRIDEEYIPLPAYLPAGENGGVHGARRETVKGARYRRRAVPRYLTKKVKRWRFVIVERG